MNIANPCQSRESNPGSLAPQSEALPLHNWTYRLKSGYIVVEA